MMCWLLKFTEENKKMGKMKSKTEKNKMSYGNTGKKRRNEIRKNRKKSKRQT